MKATKVKIENVLGIQEIEFRPGERLTVISGANRTGKSSVLKALGAILEAGEDATLLRQGAAKGEAVLLVDEGFLLKRSWTEKGVYRAVVHEREGKVPGGALSWIEDVLDPVTANPMAWLSAPPREQARRLLEAIPLRLTVEELAEATGKAAPELERYAAMHGLAAIDALIKAVKEERRVLNVAADEKRATIKTVDATIPKAPAGWDSWQQALDAAIHAQLAVQRRWQAAGAELEKDWKADKGFLKAAFDRREAEARRVRDAAIAEAHRAYGEAVAAARAEHDGAVAKRDEEYRAEAAAQDAEAGPDREKAAGEVERAKAEVEATIKAQQAAEFVRGLKVAAEREEEESRRLTAAVGRLQTLQDHLLERNPLKTVSVRGEDIFVEGIPLEHVNTAERVKLALELARLRAGRFGLTRVDDMEFLDRDTFEEFERQAEAAPDLQFIVVRLAEGPLRIFPGPVCGSCNGVGTIKGKTCPTCGGSGKLQEAVQ